MRKREVAMAELARFQITRRTERNRISADGQVFVYPDRAAPTALLQAVIDAVQGTDNDTAPSRAVRALARAFLKRKAFLDPDAPTASQGLKAEIPKLDQWLTRHPDASLDDLDAVLFAAAVRLGLKDATPETAAATIVASDKWATFRATVGDSLVSLLLGGNGATVVEGGDREEPPTHLKAARLTRWVVVCGLVESLAGCDRDLPPLRALLKRQPVLPCPPFPLPFRSRLARLPAFSDLYVVRDEWARYVPGEIAHIENVLKGELKERIHKRIDETETVETRSQSETTIAERSTETTDRTLLKEESQVDTDLTVSVEGQVDTAGQYGPTHVETHIGGSVEYSRAESSRRATEQAHETVERAISRTELRVSEARTRRTLQRIEDRERHLVDNAKDPDGHVTGVYRWVDKIQRFQVFRYPHRYLLEFQIPEPATFVRWLAAHAPDPRTVYKEPDPFTVTGKEGGERLTAAHIKADTYSAFAARYDVTGLPEPPDPEIAVSEAFVVSAGERKDTIDNWSTIPFPPSGAQAKELAIPEGYAAVSAVGSVSAPPELASWKTWTDWGNQEAGGKDGVHEKVGWHEIVATLEIAGRTARAATQDADTAPANTVIQVPGLYHGFWLTEEFRWKQNGAERRQLSLDTRPTGKLSVTATVGGAYKAGVSVAVMCQPTEATWATWRNEVFARIHAGYADMLVLWQSEQATLDEEPLIPVPQGSPARHREVVREELKRQVIESFIGKRFEGMAALEESEGTWSRMDLDKAQAVGPYLQFLEQAIEWSTMTYILYPYFWADSTRWDELQQTESADPEYDKFLRSGSARVVVAARPGFECAVNHFMIFGEPWGGDPAPVPGDELYVSVAQELKELTQAPADGIPGETWEARLPTTLLWLDTDSTLPKENEHATLPEGIHHDTPPREAS